MHIQVSVEVNVPPEQVWAVMRDVERWPEWTASMSSVELLGSGEFGPVSRVRIRQPRLPVAEWRVTSFEPGEGFTWTAGGPGMHTVADHRIRRSSSGRSVVTLDVRSGGPAAWLLTPWLSRITRRYLRMEAEGLKSRCEAGLGEPADS